MRRNMVLLSVAALAVSGVVAVPSAAVAEPAPTFHVSRDSNGIIGGSYWPAGVDLAITADDPDTTKDPDIELTLTTNAEGGFNSDVQVFPGLEPGWVITVTDGMATKTHTVRDIAITGVDPTTDTMRGTAEPFSEVRASEDHDAASYWVTADGTGQWSADFSGDYDITPGTRMRVLQMDEDGDFTFTDWVVPRPAGRQYNPATGHFYEQVGPYNWADAEAYAVSVGGHLVTISNQAEQDWLAATFTQPNLLIGFSDLAVEGTWVWSSGEPVTYTNWTIGEPNNCTECPGDPNGEDVAVTNWTDPFGNVGWNDLNSSSLFDAIVEAADVPVGPLLDNMVADGQLPNAGVANSILKLAAGKAPLKALTNHLTGLVRAGKITQLTMDEILASLPG